MKPCWSLGSSATKSSPINSNTSGSNASPSSGKNNSAILGYLK